MPATPDPQDLQIARAISDKIIALLGARLHQIVLFGSRARGDGDEESDYDFLIVADFEERSWPKRSSAIRRSLGDAEVPVDYMTVTPEELQQKLLIRSAIEKEGIVLYERDHEGMGAQG